MDTTLYKEYALLELEFKALEDKRTDLRKRILEEMMKTNTPKFEEAYGSFTVGHKYTWTYSDALRKAEEQLKIKKMREQDKGIAKSSDTPFLLYKAPKVIA